MTKDRPEKEPILSVVVPLFDEEANLHELYHRTTASLESLDLTFELILVNDGSRDATEEIIGELQRSDSRIAAIHLSRNFGHQPAICAGLDQARGHAVIIIDGDLQDAPELIGDFVERWRAGFQVVYGVRTQRKENILKRTCYYLFYRLLRAVSDLEIPLDSGDFCLMDRKVVEVLKHLPERMRFVRGLRTFVGFRQCGVQCERAARAAGKSKYSVRALVRLAIDGLFDFSSFPLRTIGYFGLLTVSAALLFCGWMGWTAWSDSEPPSGWALGIAVMLVMGAVQLLSIRIVGEYIRRIFAEAKGRPAYIVREVRIRETTDSTEDDQPVTNEWWADHKPKRSRRNRVES